MINQLLLNEINKVLGVGKPTARLNYSYNCPVCKHPKPKLEINFDEESSFYQNYSCWVCGVKGKSLFSLLKKINLPQDKLDRFKPFIKSKSLSLFLPKEEISLPKEFKSLISISDYDVVGKQALNYLRKRNIGEDDIIKYNLGYCEYGSYINRIIIPSYNFEGNLNYFTARSFDGSNYKYKNPSYSRNIIPFEFFINWELPIILCEGPFDAIAIKRNVIPLLGKTISENLMKKIITSKVNKIYIALDKDAFKQTLNLCEKLMNLGKKIYLIELPGKDPADLGFENFTLLVQKAKQLNFSKLLENKLKI